MQIRIDASLRSLRSRNSSAWLAIVFIVSLSGCALCPSMDDNCWLIRHMNGETDGPVPLTAEDACNEKHGTVVLKAGEFYRCNP